MLTTIAGLFTVSSSTEPMPRYWVLPSTLTVTVTLSGRCRVKLLPVFDVTLPRS